MFIQVIRRFIALLTCPQLNTGCWVVTWFERNNFKAIHNYILARELRDFFVCAFVPYAFSFLIKHVANAVGQNDFEGVQQCCSIIIPTCGRYATGSLNTFWNKLL